MVEAGEDLPWATPPSGKGENECSWCHRVIYLPAVPCSIRPVTGLLGIQTRSGQGERCKYEVSTRRPELPQ